MTGNQAGVSRSRLDELRTDYGRQGRDLGTEDAQETHHSIAPTSARVFEDVRTSLAMAAVSASIPPRISAMALTRRFFSSPRSVSSLARFSKAGLRRPGAALGRYLRSYYVRFQFMDYSITHCQEITSWDSIGPLSQRYIN